MRFSKEFRRIAWSALENNYWIAFLVTLTAALLGGVTGSGIGFGSMIRYSVGDVNIREHVFSSAYALPLFALIVTLIVSVGIFAVVQFLIGGAVELGLCRYTLDVIDRRDARYSALFTGFDNFGKALGLRCYTLLLTLLWSLLLIFPGIVAALRYAMAPFIMAEHPEIGVKEAINRSKKFMHGNKWRLLKLYLSFFGWFLLSALTAGIGNFFLAPYVRTAVTAFYLEVSGQSYRLEGYRA